MAKIIIIPENSKNKTYKNIYKYAVSLNPDHIFKVCINKGVRQLNDEFDSVVFANSGSWIIKALENLVETVNFVEDEVMILTEEIYANQLKVWFSNYSIPFWGMTKQEMNRALNRTLMRIA